MKPLLQHIRLEGLGATRQLSALQREGHTLYDIRSSNPSSVEFGCRIADSAAILALLRERGFSCTLLPARGTAQSLESLKTASPLIVFFLCALLCLSFSLQYVWRIEIDGAGAYAGEIRTLLREENIRIGRAISSIDTSALSQKITLRLPRIAWARVSVTGLTLQIDITQGVPAPDIQTAGANGHIVAISDGVIESISVYAGTPVVKAGDTVKAGDLLIQGVERGSNDTLIPVRARGQIVARTYISESASVSARSFSSERTGKAKTIKLLHFFSHALSLSSSPNYLTSEYESQFLPVGGVFFPLQMEKRTVYELALSSAEPDESALKADLSRLLMQKLLLRCAENDEIIDKWLYYSMIEGGIMSATVTAEVRTQLGVFSPETPE